MLLKSTFLGGQTFHGASIFSQRPCITNTLRIDDNEKNLLNEALENFDGIVSRTFPFYASYIKANPSNHTSNEQDTQLTPLQHSRLSICISRLCSALIAQVQLEDTEVFIKQFNPQLEHITITLSNKLLSSNLIHLASLYVFSIFPTHITLQNTPLINSEQLKNHINLLIKNNAQFQKSRFTREVQHALLSKNIPWLALDDTIQNKNFFQFGFGRNQIVMDGSVSSVSSGTYIDISKSKLATSQLLIQLSFPAPKQLEVNSAQHALHAAKSFGYPLVLKAEYGTQGNFVFADLKNEDALSAAYSILSKKTTGTNNRIFLEQHVVGKTYRVETIKGKVFDVYYMIPANIVGDGESSIKELIAQENSKPSRNSAESGSSELIPLTQGKSEEAYLSSQGLSFDSIPQKQQTVFLRANSNWSSGGQCERVTELLHPDNLRLMQQVAKQFPIDLLGIDIICKDISESYLQETFQIIEINHSPAIFEFSEGGNNFNIINRVVGNFSENRKYGDVPIFILSKSASSQHILQQLEAHLNKLNYHAGVIHEQSIAINGESFVNRNNIEINRKLSLLRNKNVGAVICEKSGEELIKSGLGTSDCDIALISDTREQAIQNIVFPPNIAWQKSIALLAQSARLACVVVITHQEDINFCLEYVKASNAKKLFMIFSTPIHSEFKNDVKNLSTLGANFLELASNSAEHIHLGIFYQEQYSATALNCSSLDLHLSTIINYTCDIILQNTIIN